MNFEYKGQLPAEFPADAKVWIYQSTGMFQSTEAAAIKEMLHNFINGWSSHGSPVKGFAHLFFGHFIVLMADERATGVSGCSTDSSVRLIKEIEKRFQVNMFDRQMLAFQVKENIQVLPMNQLKYAADNHFINQHTIYFNNLIQNKSELETSWMIPIKDSWLSQRISFPESVS